MSNEKIVQYLYPKNISSEEYNNRRVTFIVTDNPSSRKRFNENSKELINTAFQKTKGFLEKTGVTSMVANTASQGYDAAVSATAEAVNMDDAELKGNISDFASSVMTKVGNFWDNKPLDTPEETAHTIGGIMLPLPNQLVDSASHSWNLTHGLTGMVKNYLTSKTDRMAEFGGSNLTQMMQYGLQYTTGKQYTLDPGYWQMYKGSEPRRFSLTYEFVPNSHEEAENIIEIITTFKKYSSPLLRAGSTVLESPYYWTLDISNPTISALISMDNVTITEVQVTYGADGAMSLFADGMPKMITMTLSMQETTAPYREDINRTTDQSRSTSNSTSSSQSGYGRDVADDSQGSYSSGSSNKSGLTSENPVENQRLIGNNESPDATPNKDIKTH